MDLKVYEKTRYQNIYRHKKNKNLIIMISKPIKTSIARDSDNNKIFDNDLAIKIRDSYLKNCSKDKNKAISGSFDVLWSKYIDWCKYSQKMAYNTIFHKEKDYKQFFKEKITIPIRKTDSEYWSKYIDKLNTTDKRKNEIIKMLKAFFNWLYEEDYIQTNPMQKIKRYKVQKVEMKYWTPEEIKQFFDVLSKDLTSDNLKTKRKAKMLYLLVHISLATGNRIGETRALKFNSFDINEKTINIAHSINYDRSSPNFVDNTKTYTSQRTNYLTSRIIQEIQEYKEFLEEILDREIDNNNLIFFNYYTNKPITDTAIRKDLKEYCNKANIKYITPYCLRHTFATNLTAKNIPIPYIQESLGHKTINTTINQYVHTRKDIKITTAEEADNYF